MIGRLPSFNGTERSSSGKIATLNDAGQYGKQNNSYIVILITNPNHQPALIHEAIRVFIGVIDPCE
jgi:hypothetical protein